MKLNQPAYAATSPVPGGRIAQQEACCRSGSIRATTYAKGLKDHPRHAEAVPTSFAPSVNFEILDMVERGDWVAVRWQLTATCDGLSSNIVRTGGSDGVMPIAQPLTATHAARGSRRALEEWKKPGSGCPCTGGYVGSLRLLALLHHFEPLHRNHEHHPASLVIRSRTYCAGAPTLGSSAERDGPLCQRRQKVSFLAEVTPDPVI